MIILNLYPATTAGTSVTTGTAPVDLGDSSMFAFQAVFTGSDVVGTFKLQRSVDGTNFEDIPGATKSVTGSATCVLDQASQTGNPSTIGFRFVRFQWTYTSGTGNLSVIAIVKQNQVYS